MTRKETKIIIGYYSDISNMMAMLREERSELEDLHYNALGAAAADGMPHAGTPGKPVEGIAITAAEKGVGERLAEIAKRLVILAEDAHDIRACMDGIGSRYNRILSMRYGCKDSWGKISASLGTPDSTVRSWHNRALDIIGEALDNVPTIGEIWGRASRARE